MLTLRGSTAGRGLRVRRKRFASPLRALVLRCAAPRLGQAGTVQRSGSGIVRRGIGAVQCPGRGVGAGCDRVDRLTVMTWDRDPNETSILLLLRS